MKKYFVILLSIITVFTLVTCSVAAEKIPVPDSLKGKTITLYCGWVAGGGSDLEARTLQQIIKERQDLDIVVENIEGANGNIALMRALNGPKDGTIINLGGPGIPLYMNDGTIPFEAEAYTFIGSLIKGCRTLIVKKDSPIQTFDQFLELLKSDREEPIQIGVSSPGGPSEGAALGMIAALDASPEDLICVSFSGGAARPITELIGGHIPFVMCKYNDAATQISAGEVKPILTLAYDRIDSFPDVPAITEFDFWGDRVPYGDPQFLTDFIVGPPGMPQDVVDYYAAIFKDAVESDRFQEVCKSWGVLSLPVISGQELTDIVVSTRKEFGVMMDLYFR